MTAFVQVSRSLRRSLPIGLALLAGCTGAGPDPTAQAPPFVFRALKLEQKNKEGLMDWSLNSPEARYELSRRLVRARQPVGVLFRNGKPVSYTHLTLPTSVTV